MTVYIVTQGEYSDYRIVSVFTDREKAERFCAFKNDECSDAAFIEEYEADIDIVETEKKVRLQWTAAFDRYGGLTYLDEGKLTFNGKDRIYSAQRRNVYGLSNSVVYVEMSLSPKVSRERAKKIACDRYAKWKYEQIEKDGE